MKFPRIGVHGEEFPILSCSVMYNDASEFDEAKQEEGLGEPCRVATAHSFQMSSAHLGEVLKRSQWSSGETEDR